MPKGIGAHTPLPEGRAELSTGRIVRGDAAATMNNMERNALIWISEHAGEVVTTEALRAQV